MSSHEHSSSVETLPQLAEAPRASPTVGHADTETALRSASPSQRTVDACTGSVSLTSSRGLVTALSHCVASAITTTGTASFPQELLAKAIEHLEGEPEALANVVLANKNLCSLAQPLLFQRICIARRASKAALPGRQLIEFMDDSLHLLRFVRKVILDNNFDDESSEISVDGSENPPANAWLTYDEDFPQAFETLLQKIRLEEFQLVLNVDWRDLSTPTDRAISQAFNQDTITAIYLDQAPLWLAYRCDSPLLSRLSLTMDPTTPPPTMGARWNRLVGGVCMPESKQKLKYLCVSDTWNNADTLSLLTIGWLQMKLDLSELEEFILEGLDVTPEFGTMGIHAFQSILEISANSLRVLHVAPEFCLPYQKTRLEREPSWDSFELSLPTLTDLRHLSLRIFGDRRNVPHSDPMYELHQQFNMTECLPAPMPLQSVTIQVLFDFDSPREVHHDSWFRFFNILSNTDTYPDMEVVTIEVSTEEEEHLEGVMRRIEKAAAGAIVASQPADEGVCRENPIGPVIEIVPMEPRWMRGVAEETKLPCKVEERLLSKAREWGQEDDEEAAAKCQEEDTKQSLNVVDESVARAVDANWPGIPGPSGENST